MKTTDQTALEYLAEEFKISTAELRSFIITNEVRLYPEKEQDEILVFADEFNQRIDLVPVCQCNLLRWHYNKENK